MNTIIHPLSRLSGEIRVPGDKSISHRALMFGSIATGTTEIFNLATGKDVQSTWECLKKLGISIQSQGNKVTVEGQGSWGLKPSSEALDCGNSGTTLRLLMGILAGQPFSTKLIGDNSLSQRPMSRIARPLMEMGAQIDLTNEHYAPVRIQGKQKLRGMDYSLPVASAQLKSSLLLAGLFAEGETILRGKLKSRDHTENLLPHFGVHLDLSEKEIRIRGGQNLSSAKVIVPGDFSSAAFWIAAASIVPGSKIELLDVSLNPSRVGFLKVLERMGAQFEIEKTQEHPEPMGTIRATFAELKSTEVHAEEVPFLVDEIPLLAILATYAQGTTVVRGAEELRIKETDRIEAVAQNLRKMGAEVETFADGFAIRGPQPLTGTVIDSFHDHRIAMAFSIAALRASGVTDLSASECVEISYPSFFETLRMIQISRNC